MTLLIDTNVLIAYERRSLRLSALADVGPNDRPAAAAITISELLAGAHRADSIARRQKRDSFVAEVIQQLDVLAFDLAVARVHAEIWAKLATAGNMIGPHDLIIAATALTQWAWGTDRERAQVRARA